MSQRGFLVFCTPMTATATHPLVHGAGSSSEARWGGALYVLAGAAASVLGAAGVVASADSGAPAPAAGTLKVGVDRAHVPWPRGNSRGQARQQGPSQAVWAACASRPGPWNTAQHVSLPIPHDCLLQLHMPSNPDLNPLQPPR